MTPNHLWLSQVLRPAKLWCDVESAAEAIELSERFEFTIPPGKRQPLYGPWVRRADRDKQLLGEGLSCT